MSKAEEHAVEAVAVEHEQSRLGLPETSSVSGNVQAKAVHSVSNSFSSHIHTEFTKESATDVISIIAGRAVRCHQRDAYSTMEQIFHPAIL